MPLPPPPLDPSNPPEAPVVAGNGPIKDQEGRIHYIVDLRDDATKGYPNINPPQDKFPDYHKPKMRHLLKDIEKQYALSATNLNSWVANSFSAYLTPGQVEKLKKDKRVTLITENAVLEYSALWLNTTTSFGEIIPWGVNAVGTRLSNNYFRVYVLDSGVAYHTDLPNVIARLAAPGFPLIGCYAHATHLAGTIGAATNNRGVIGVDANVSIVSVAVGDLCSGGPKVTSVSDGMDLNLCRYGILGRRRYRQYFHEPAPC